MIDTVRDRLSDRHVGAGQRRESAAQRRQQLSTRADGVAEADVDLGRFHALDVLVELGAPRAPGGRHHLGLGQHDLLDTPSDLVRLRERRAGERIGLDGQAAFMKLRQKGRACAGQRDRGGGEQRRGSDHHEKGMVEHAREVLREPRLERPRQPAVVTSFDRPRKRQKRIGQRRRDDDGHEKGREERHDVRECEWCQQAAFDACKPEDRQEHEHDDDRGKDDGGANLERRIPHDVSVRALLANWLRVSGFLK